MPLNNIIYYIFIYLLIFAPLAFGLEELWSITIMEALCFAAVFFYFCNSKNRKTIYRVPGLLPLVLILSYMLLQVIPLPVGLVELISPATLALYQGTIGIVEMPAFISLSVNTRSTLEEFFRFSSYVSFYVLSIQLLTQSKKLQKTVIIVLGLCSFIALEAILQRYLDNGRIYWVREVPPKSSFTGPYFYHNHFAGYVEMMVPLALALFFRYRPPMHYGNSWREQFANMLSHIRFNTHLLLGFATALMAVSIFVSMSRGGIISFGLSCFILLTVLARREKNKSLMYQSLILFAVIFLAIGWFGWDNIDRRFGVMFDAHGEFIEARPLIWQDTIKIIKDFPVFGSGWGTFGDIYPTYRYYVEENFPYHAHNDYIETMTNGGIVSLLLIGWFLGIVFRQILKALSKRRDSYAIYLSWGALAGILAIIIHSFMDFNFQNGANGLYFFFLLALAVAASHTHLHGKKLTSLLPNKKSSVGYFAMLGSGFLLLASLWVNGGDLWVNGQLSPMEPANWNDDTPQEELWNNKDRLDKALEISPLNSKIYFLLAEVNKSIGENEAAAKYYRKAIKLNPIQATYLQNYGMFLEKNGEHSLADSFMVAGVRHDIIEPDRKRNYARFLFNNNEKEIGLQVMSAVFAQDPKKARSDIVFLVDSGFSDDEIRMNLPSKVVPLLSFADYLEQKGDREQAATIYRQALTNIDNEKAVRPEYFYPASRFFRKQKRYDEALDIILQAIEFFPANAMLRVEAGNLYRDMGLRYQAIKEYQQALAIDQLNPEARKHLAELRQGADKKIKL